MPVSYTHLDVYKRQTMVTAMRETLVSAGVEENDIRTDEFVGY